MAALMLYSLVVAGLAAGAAAGLEGSGWGRRTGHTRWLWAGCLVAIVGATGWAAVAPPAAPRHPPVVPSGGIEVPVSGTPAPTWPTVTVPAPPAPDLDPLLARLWLLLSAATAVALGIAGLRMHRRRDGWEPTEAGDGRVWISDDLGPGVVGVVSPRVVVPRWVTGLGPSDRALLLRHERAHLDARDPQLLALGLAALVVLPWNPFVWWAVVRLRAAVEVDCDRRVLRRSPDPVEYARLLVHVGERRLRIPVGIAPFTRSTSLLERRIRTMLDPTPRRPVRTALLTLLAAGLVAGACSVERPTAPTEPVDPVAAANGAGALDDAPFDVDLRVDGTHVGGRVSDLVTGAGIPGVQVFLPSLGMGALTNIRGGFELLKLPPGIHGLEFTTREGADTVRLRVTVGPTTPEQKAAMPRAGVQPTAAEEAARGEEPAARAQQVAEREAGLRRELEQRVARVEEARGAERAARARQVAEREAVLRRAREQRTAEVEAALRRARAEQEATAGQIGDHEAVLRRAREQQLAAEETARAARAQQVAERAAVVRREVEQRVARLEAARAAERAVRAQRTAELEAALRRARGEQRAAVDAARAAGRGVLPPAPAPRESSAVRTVVTMRRMEGAPPPVEPESFGALYVIVGAGADGPVEGARVHLPALDREAVTDGEGRAMLQRVPPGRWAVQVARPGGVLSDPGVHFDVEAGETRAVIFTLAPAGSP